MRKKIVIPITALLFIVAIVCGSFTQNAYAEETRNTEKTFNHWILLNFNLWFNQNFYLHIMPGNSYEYWNNNHGKASHHKGTFLTELYVGPGFSYNITPELNFRFGVEYYYMGFSPQYDTDFIQYSNHVMWVIAQFAYKIDPVTLSSRTVFHNVFHTTGRHFDQAKGGPDSNTATLADKQPIDFPARSGYGMLMRELITVSYKVNSLITLSLGNEFFVGCVQKAGLVGTDRNSLGFNEYRAIPGITFTEIVPGLSVNINYLWRIKFSMTDQTPDVDRGDITNNMHYVLMIVTYNFKPFQ